MSTHPVQDAPTRQGNDVAQVALAPPAIVEASDTGRSFQVILCGGCFWGLEYALSAVPGVRTTPGYAGGNRSVQDPDGSLRAIKPTYYNIGDTGDAEAVRVELSSDAQVQEVLREFDAHSRRDPSPASWTKYARRLMCPDAAGLERIGQALRELDLHYEATLDDTFVPAEARHHGHYLQLYGPIEPPDMI